MERDTIQSKIRSLARTLVGQIPEIAQHYNHEYNKRDMDKEHYLYRHYTPDNVELRKLQMYWYERPNAANDWVMVAYSDVDDSENSWLKCFTLDRKTGALRKTELPFDIPPPHEFDKKEFDKEDTYYRTYARIFNDGNILISATASQERSCILFAHRNEKGSFTLYKRGIYMCYCESAPDDAAAEQYVQEVVRPNYQRIVANDKWVWIEEKEVDADYMKNAKVSYYYSKEGLEKIVAKNSDETCEYYFVNHYLSFIFSSRKESSGNNTERRFYFKDGFCFRGIGNNGKKFSPDKIEGELHDAIWNYYTIIYR
jgi:hypothetical protein